MCGDRFADGAERTISDASTSQIGFQAAQAGDRDAARQILSGGPMTNALLNHLREQMGKRASALGIGVADRLAKANVAEPNQITHKIV
jgi:hypothetical protein